MPAPSRSRKRDDMYRDRRRRKVCAFCADKSPQIDYKEVNRLRRYLSERAKIEPRRKTGTCAQHQREQHDAEAQGRRRAEATRKAKAERLGVSPSTLPLKVKPVVLADRTVARIVCPLSAALTTAVGDGLIDRNPARDAVLPKRDQQRAIDEGRELEPEAVKAMTNAELVAFLRACPAEWQPLFRLLASTGLRFSEAAALRWQDVDLTGPNPQVKVRRAYVKGRMGPPKSKMSRREVPIGPDVIEHLQAHYQQTQWAGPDHLVFSSQAGTPLVIDNVRKRVLHPAAVKAGLVRAPKVGGNPVPWVGFHTFRHTCATRLFGMGRNVKLVQHRLGHHSAAFTLETYVHLLRDDQDTPLPPPEVEAPAEAPAEAVAA